MNDPDATRPTLIGIDHLYEMWQRSREALAGRPVSRTESVWIKDNIVMCGLGLPIETTTTFLMFERPSFEGFEQWIIDINHGSIDPLAVERIRCALDGVPYGSEIAETLRAIDEADDVLTADDLAFWDENGYVIVRSAVTPDEAKLSESAVWERLEMSPDDPSTWYGKPIGKGIMMDLYHQEVLIRNRRSSRIHKAFAQLWGESDLWVTTDRTSFNPPVRPGYQFQGPDLHWDMSLAEPFYFGTQGILYLCDTAADQGAFTLVPGFHREIGPWLDSLPDRNAARDVDLSDRAKPIAASAGDLIIWHQYLPHGASPNRANYPRIVQYINMFATSRRENMNWI